METLSPSYKDVVILKHTSAIYRNHFQGDVTSPCTRPPVPFSTPSNLNFSHVMEMEAGPHLSQITELKRPERQAQLQDSQQTGLNVSTDMQP